jgi:transposase
LEKLAKSDLPGIYHGIAFEALEKEGIRLDQTHLDTTSLSVQGAYETADSKEASLQITFGHSKERRPDLKQLMFGLGRFRAFQSSPMSWLETHRIKSGMGTWPFG